MFCQRCHERDATVYLVTPGAKSPSQEEQHLCQPCFEESFQHHPEVLEQLRKAEAEGKAKAEGGASCGWTSYRPDIRSDES